MVKKGHLVENGYIRFWVFCSYRMNKVSEHRGKWVFGENEACSILGISLKQDKSGI